MFGGFRYNPHVIEQLKQLALHNKFYVWRAAVVGIEGMKKIIYHAVMKFSGRSIMNFTTDSLFGAVAK